jgi:hypothetical protein
MLGPFLISAPWPEAVTTVARAIASAFYIQVNLGGAGYQTLFHLLLGSVVCSIVYAYVPKRRVLTRLGWLGGRIFYTISALVATLLYLPIVRFLLRVYSCTAAPALDPSAVVPGGNNTAVAELTVPASLRHSVELPSEGCYSPLHIYYCVVSPILLVLLFLNAHRWITLNPVERAKDKEVRPFAFAPGRSRYAAIALSVKSVFIVPLVYLSSHSDPRIPSGILCALTWYFFLASIAWAPYINYSTNRSVAAALAAVAWTCTCSFVFSCIPVLSASPGGNGVPNNGTWYGFLAWILGTVPMALIGYRLSLHRQKRTLRLVIQPRLTHLFGSGQPISESNAGSPAPQ